MRINKFIKNLLGFKELKVTFFSMDSENLYLWVAPYKNGCLCPTCNRRCPVIRKLEQPRRWKDLKIAGRNVYLIYRPREISCPTHGRTQELIPWAREYSRITYRFEYRMLRYCQMMTQKDAAMLLGIATSTLSDLLHKAIQSIRKNHKIRGLKRIGVDEVSYKKGRKFATLVYDLERSCVLWVGKGKGRECIDKFFNTKLSDYQKRQIQWGSCDMSDAYIGAIQTHCPNARLVLDRFHIVKSLNNAVDEIRKEQWRTSNIDQRKAMRGLRWILYRHSSNRSSEDQAVLKTLNRANRRIFRASQLKDEFEQFWDYEESLESEAFLKQWMTTALKSRLEPIRKFVRTLRKHLPNVLSFTDSRLTNAVGEGLNRIVKIVKNRASGYRNLDAFTDMIYLNVGDLDIPDQIPKSFQLI